MLHRSRDSFVIHSRDNFDFLPCLCVTPTRAATDMNCTSSKGWSGLRAGAERGMNCEHFWVFLTNLQHCGMTGAQERGGNARSPLVQGDVCDQSGRQDCFPHGEAGCYFIVIGRRRECMGGLSPRSRRCPNIIRCYTCFTLLMNFRDFPSEHVITAASVFTMTHVSSPSLLRTCGC